MAQRGRPLYEDRNARISILAAAVRPTCRIRLCRLFTPSSNRRLHRGGPYVSAMGGAVSLHVAGVDRRRQRKHAPGNKGIKDAAPQLSARPAIEAVVDRRGRTVFGRAVLPAAAGLQHMQDAADDAPIIDPARARLVPWKVRFDRRPRLVVQPEKPAHHRLRRKTTTANLICCRPSTA